MSATNDNAPYRPPVEDVLSALHTAGLDQVLALPAFAAHDTQLVAEVLREFGRFSAEVVAPTDRLGDVEGARFDAASGKVLVPEPVRRAYERYVEAGWGSLQFPAEHGGGGFPAVVGLAMQELLASANLSFSLNPVLTQSAIEVLLDWGDDRQQAMYLPKLLSGEWSGTMNLTEAEAGSDLGAVATRAEPLAGGGYRLVGTKIFITWGEHELSRNIVHLVLARTPGAAPGTRGLSLFLVPKLLVRPDGSPGEPNALRCLRIEHKLGIHLSPTCVMSYEGAVGELVGPEGAGMRAMFTMMNRARLSIGAEGPAVGERAYQQAAAYAAERRQGRSGAGPSPAERSLLREHADVRRMLLSMRTGVLATRLVLLYAGAQLDLARHHPEASARERAQALLDLLTPVAKAWSSDVGFASASTGVQVLGGAGFVEETGIAQRLRDGRIAPIYEGTNGIQAIDLVMRKLPRASGAAVNDLFEQIAQLLKTGPSEPGGSELEPTFAALGEAHEVLGESTGFMLSRVAEQPEDALAGAAAYLELLGTTLGGWLLARRALMTARRGEDPGSVAAALGECNFYAATTLGRAAGLRRPITAGAALLRVGIAAAGEAPQPREVVRRGASR